MKTAMEELIELNENVMSLCSTKSERFIALVMVNNARNLLEKEKQQKRTTVINAYLTGVAFVSNDDDSGWAIDEAEQYYNELKND